MNVAIVFLAGLATTMGVVFVALLYLRNPLQKILTDLCGTAERAHFWTVFSNITLFLVPFVLALNHDSETGAPQASVFAISSQIEYAIAGFVVAVVVLGFVLSIFISRTNPISAAKGNNAL